MALFAHSVKDALTAAIAMQKAFESMPMPLGVLYKNESSTFENRVRHGETKPLYTTKHDINKIQEIFKSY